MLVAFDDLTPAMAARALGINPSAFRVRLHRARRRFLAALDVRAASPPEPKWRSHDRASGNRSTARGRPGARRVRHQRGPLRPHRGHARRPAPAAGPHGAAAADRDAGDRRRRGHPDDRRRLGGERDQRAAPLPQQPAVHARASRATASGTRRSSARRSGAPRRSPSREPGRPRSGMRRRIRAAGARRCDCPPACGRARRAARAERCRAASPPAPRSTAATPSM